MVDQIHREACTLAILYDTLLPELIFGELRVNNAESAIGSVL
jgi:hypothetical protein